MKNTISNLSMNCKLNNMRFKKARILKKVGFRGENSKSVEQKRHDDITSISFVLITFLAVCFLSLVSQKFRSQDTKLSQVPFTIPYF